MSLRFKTAYLPALPLEIEDTAQVFLRLDNPEVIIETDLEPDAISPITAADMPTPKVNWDGELLVAPTPEEKNTKTEFSAISVILVVMIVLVCLLVAYMNRILIVEKLKCSHSHKDRTK